MSKPETIHVYDLAHTRSLDVSDPVQAAAVWDEIHAVATLQGIVNRRAPRLYLRYVEHEGVNIDDWWLEQLSGKGEWLHGVERRTIDSLQELVSTFRGDIQGTVLYDSRVPATSNLASAIAGARDLVAIRYDERSGSVYRRLVTDGGLLPVRASLINDDGTPQFSDNSCDVDGKPIGSAKCAAYLWGVRELIDSGKCSPDFLGYYLDCDWIQHATAAVAEHHTLVNHDFFVARRAFFCDLHCWGDEAPIDDPSQPLGADLRTLETILGALRRRARGMIHVGGFTPWAFKYTSAPHAGGRHDPVATEWELVRLVSRYRAFLDADAIGLGAMANASFFMHFPLREKSEQAAMPDESALRRRGFVDASGAPVDDREFAMFYVGDYDSAAWLYKCAPTLWRDPRRGAAPLSWAISPVLDRRAPMTLDYLWRTRSDSDAFIAADNGAGYLNPSALPSEDLDIWREHCATYYRRWDLSITGFIIDGHAPAMSDAALDAYAAFSPDGIVPQKTAAAALLHERMPVLRSGPDITAPDPAAAAADILRHIESSREKLPFFWFRTILKTPGWHADVVREVCTRRSDVEFVAAPVFFELLRRKLARDSG